MFTKEKIFNIALGALLLTRRVANADNDTSKEAVCLNTFYETALYAALEDMDLDATSMTVTLEKIATLENQNWMFVYRYPANCALFRRVNSCAIIDNRSTQIPKRVGLYKNNVTSVRAVFTNEDQATAEIIPTDFPLDALTANAGLAVGYRLAMLASPLIVGKGADRLMKTITQQYITAKTEAQESDRIENFNFEDPAVESEFVQARTT